MLVQSPNILELVEIAMAIFDFYVLQVICTFFLAGRHAAMQTMSQSSISPCPFIEPRARMRTCIQLFLIRCISL